MTVILDEVNMERARAGKQTGPVIIGKMMITRTITSIKGMAKAGVIGNKGIITDYTLRLTVSIDTDLITTG